MLAIQTLSMILLSQSANAGNQTPLKIKAIAEVLNHKIKGNTQFLSSKQSTKLGKSPLSSRKEEDSATGEKGRQATIRSPRKERGKGNIHTQNLS